MRRARLACVVSLSLFVACGPNLPPTVAPAQPDPTFDPLRTELQAYIEETQPYRKAAAQAQENTPGQGSSTPAAAQALRTRENTLAQALATKLRANAKPGDIFKPPIADALRHQIADAFSGPQMDLLLDDMAEQLTTPAKPEAPRINQRLEAPRVPPRLAALLPPLPKQLEYDFTDRTLLLRDVDADLVVDFLPDAFPVKATAGVPTRAETPLPAGSAAPLAMPTIRGGTVFALMGDSGSGDTAQRDVAQAMLTYFNTARRFSFVLMLGDNLYHDDYNGEFLEPYKPLLDRGMLFYATLGNHDRDLEIHFKPFNMQDQDRYSFDEGNARFVALNSNHPGDPAQIKWLDGVFADAGNKWRICFFHHPLYSSGEHTAEARDVIRPALEDALVRNKVDVVFSGHEHLYERIHPQRGIRYFVSGGGGRNLYGYHASDFDEVGVSEHHFMVAEIAGDRLFFEAVTHGQKLLDCGVIYRRADVKPDADTTKWLAQCDAARPRVTTTASPPAAR
ncbi:MAG TPA: metallophosphoesterase [Vicinamibacterales bacterium]|nr:metallophosphoesterase [Vicinamibacterales bacterium]